MALCAVLDDIKARGIEQVFCLGDLVGYGPDPLFVVTTAMGFDITIMGNHDMAVLDGIPANFNPIARRASEWTRKELDPNQHNGLFKRAALKSKKDAWSWLNALPLQVERGTDLFLHDTPIAPGSSHYVHALADAQASFRMHPSFMRFFIGHSHLPMIFTPEKSLVPKRGKEYKFDCPAIFNVGSVGQPRDGDPRASYAIVGEGVTFMRVEYDVEETVRRILANPELDNFLARRLTTGK
jgi:diadenosine tetraphosphatase ApaH/serine/threonine PP2A family protein phosphatase